MCQTQPIGKAIEETLEQVRTELIRLYADGDVGTVTVHCGREQMRVKATPERTHEPVRLKAQ